MTIVRPLFADLVTYDLTQHAATTLDGLAAKFVLGCTVLGAAIVIAAWLLSRKKQHPQFGFFPKRRKPAYRLQSTRSIVDFAMRSNDLTPAQAQQLKESIRPMLAYLGRLKRRMHMRRFPHDDLLFRTVLNAYDAIHELNVQVHYLSCESGVGRIPPKTKCRD